MMPSASFHTVKGMFEGLPRLVNVPECAHLQPAMSTLIGPAGNVPACFIQKSQCRPHGAIGVSPGRRGGVVGVPSLFAHRFTHFMDGAVNFLDRVVPRADESRTGVRLQQFTRLPQVGEGMEIVGTLGLSRCSESKQQESRQPNSCCGKCFEHTHFSSTFHGLIEIPNYPTERLAHFLRSRTPHGVYFCCFKSLFGEESMFIALRSFIRFSWIDCVAVIPVFAAAALFAQSVAGPSTPANPAAAHAPAGDASPASCPPIPDTEIPISSTIAAKVMGVLDSGHLKVGKEIWVQVVYGVSLPGCRLNENSALYGHITSAVSQKNPNSSELSLVFDHADCAGQKKKELPLRLIALVGPPDQSDNMLAEAPIVMQGASRSAAIPGLVAAFSNVNLNPGGSSQYVHPGIVIRMSKLKLEVAGGPGCSARFSSTNHSIQLEPGSELILIP